MRGLAALLFACLALGCVKVDGDDDPDFVSRPGHVLSVVDDAGARLGEVAIVRVTQRWVVGLGRLPQVSNPAAGAPNAPPPGVRACSVVWEGKRWKAQARPCGVLTVVRAERGAGAGPLRVPLGVPLTPDRDVRFKRRDGQVLGARVIHVQNGYATLEEVQSPDEWLGGVVRRANGALAGFVTDIRDRSEGGRLGKPRLLLVQSAQAEAMAAICEAPGADALSEHDTFLAYSLRLGGRLYGEGTPLPQLSDSWGGPDVYLALDQGPDPVARFRVERQEPASLVTLRREPLLHARLVERDVTISEGVVEEDLAPALTTKLERHLLALPFVLDSGEPFPLQLEVSRLDPDATSGPDRTPLGALRLAQRRVGAGTVDLASGDATDLWRVSLPSSASQLIVVYVSDPSADLEIEGWGRGEERARWRHQTQGRRLGGLRRTLGRGETLIRVRQRQPSARPVGYALLLHPNSEREDLPRSLIRLVAAESTRGARSAFLGARGFAHEAHRVLSELGELSASEEAKGVLAELGHRIPQARHLALNLIDTYLEPSPVALELVRREGGRRGLDAGLLLASRVQTVRRYLPIWRQGEALTLAARQKPRSEEGDAEEEPLPPANDGGEDGGDPLASPAPWSSLRASEREDIGWRVEDALYEAVLDAAVDQDAGIRLRAVATAARLRDPALRQKLRLKLEELMRDEQSVSVRRALLTAFPPALR